MRPGMFENTHEDIRGAFLRTISGLNDRFSAKWEVKVSLASEHFFDALVVEAIHDGRGLPYAPDELVTAQGERRGGTILVEFRDLSPLSIIETQLFRLQTAGFIPVIAHPERYRQTWQDPSIVNRLQEIGCVALLDSCALVGKYGERSQVCARQLLDEGAYHASCSDAHRPGDAKLVGDAMSFILRHYGQEELDLLFRDGPSELLDGRRPSSM
jgi:protein-tyrosine phosphatase